MKNEIMDRGGGGGVDDREYGGGEEEERFTRGTMEIKNELIGKSRIKKKIIDIFYKK